MPKNRNHTRLLIATLLLTLIAASRFWLLPTREMNFDEVWNAFQTGDTLANTLLWVPFDWTPLHFVFLWGWQNLVSAHPYALRVSSVLFMVLASAFIFRASKRLFGNDSAAWDSVLVYAALGYGLYLSTYIRAYALLLMLLPFTLWVLLRYLDKPAIGRGIWLAIAVASLLYTSLTTAITLIALAIVALVLYRVRALWGLLPALGSLVLLIPLIISKQDLVLRLLGGRVEAAGTESVADNVLTALPPQAILDLYIEFVGRGLWLWVIGALAGLLGLVYALFQRNDKQHAKIVTRIVPALLLWALILPIALWAVQPIIGLFSAQYAWWVMLGLALIGGFAVHRVPLAGRVVLLGLLIVSLFAPPVERDEFGFNLPFEAQMRILQTEWQSGDVLFIDPNCGCGAPVEWEYFQSVYMPQGITFVDDLDTITDTDRYTRVWYLQRDGEQVSEAFQAVTVGRVAGKFFGPWNLLFRLYTAPPDPTGILYENGLRFHGAEVLDTDGQTSQAPYVFREGETVTVRLWWSTDNALPQDYSVGLHIRDDNVLLAQSDSSPTLVHPPNPPTGTSQWQTDTLYIEERQLTLPRDGLGEANFTLLMTVYQWQDGQFIPAPDIDANGFLPLLPIDIMAW